VGFALKSIRVLPIPKRLLITGIWRTLMSNSIIRVKESTPDDYGIMHRFTDRDREFLEAHTKALNRYADILEKFHGKEKTKKT